jgi:hypothetical protein
MKIYLPFLDIICYIDDFSYKKILVRLFIEVDFFSFLGHYIGQSFNGLYSRCNDFKCIIREISTDISSDSIYNGPYNEGVVLILFLII